MTSPVMSEYDASRGKRRNQINVQMSDEMLNEIAAAVHVADTVGRGPKDQTDLVVTAVRAHLDVLKDEINKGKPFDRALGGRLRERRRR